MVSGYNKMNPFLDIKLLLTHTGSEEIEHPNPTVTEMEAWLNNPDVNKKPLLVKRTCSFTPEEEMASDRDGHKVFIYDWPRSGADVIFDVESDLPITFDITSPPMYHHVLPSGFQLFQSACPYSSVRLCAVFDGGPRPFTVSYKEVWLPDARRVAVHMPFATRFGNYRGGMFYLSGSNIYDPILRKHTARHDTMTTLAPPSH